MIPALPLPLQRVHTRLLQRDAIQMLGERISSVPQVAITSWIRQSPARQQRLSTLAPVTTTLLTQIYEQANLERFGAPGSPRIQRRAAEVLFGVGLVAGCQIRDKAEVGSPMPTAVNWISALEELESSSMRQSLWSIGLPHDLTAITSLVHVVGKRLPMLDLRLLSTAEMCYSRRSAPEDGFPEALFLLGLIGAGIGLPTRGAYREVG